MNRFEERKRANDLKAISVTGLIQKSLPLVLPQLTAGELDQLQRVLDVATINADIQNQADVLDQQSIRGKIIHSNSYLRDPAVVAKRDKVLTQKIALKPGENAIHLGLHKLVSPDAFEPTSDNPDEATYMLAVADDYLHRGVWLVVDSSAAYVYQQMSVRDPGKWRVRLLLGYRPGALVEEITSNSGRLDRRSLLSVSRIGAGYYRYVNAGQTMIRLKRAIQQVEDSITNGRNEHLWWSAHRGEFPNVSRVSDFAGGATWPNAEIWQQPNNSYVRALELVNDGKFSEAANMGLLAAYQAEWCAGAVSNHVSATLKGASRVVTLLKVVETVGKVAEAILDIYFFGRGLLKLLSRKGGTLALEGGAQRRLSGGGQRLLPASTEPAIEETAKRVSQRAASNSDFARRAAGYEAEKAIWMKANPDADMSSYVKKIERLMEKWKVKEDEWLEVVSPKGTVLGRGVKPGQSSGNNGSGWGKW